MDACTFPRETKMMVFPPPKMFSSAPARPSGCAVEVLQRNQKSQCAHSHRCKEDIVLGEELVSMNLPQKESQSAFAC